MELLLKYFTVYLGSTVKFIAGPIAGEAESLSITETALCTSLGAMTSISTIILLGNWLKIRIVDRQRRLNKYVVFSKRSRRIVKVFLRFRMIGIAFLTPIVLSPIGGALAAVSFGVKKSIAIFHMAWSTLMWAFFFSWAVQTIWEDIQLLIKTYFA